jgi:hypothetical protein
LSFLSKITDMPQQGKQIHIVGCLPRSGTTLLTELMTNCFAIDAYTEHEYSIFKHYPKPYRVLCTKKPNDIKRIRFPLRVNPNLHVIYVLRDPRDAISSRSHQRNNQDKQIWGNLATWLQHHRIAESLWEHPRFVVLRYEDLVTNPDQVQDYLQAKLPFLDKKLNFSDFHKVAKPSEKTNAALGGIRPISSSSIGNWRAYMPYIKAQLEKYSNDADDIPALLIQLGYEEDRSWLEALSGIASDNSEEPADRKSIFKRLWVRYYTLPRRQFIYLLSHLRLNFSKK